MTIRGGLNCAGVTLNEVESTLKIVSNDRTSSELTKHYMNIYGGKNASGVKAGKVEIKTGYNSIINIYGGTSGNAVEVDDTLKLESNGDTSLLGNNRSAVASNITDSKNIIICNENEYNLFGGNNEYDAIKITEYCKEQYLKCIPIMKRMLYLNQHRLYLHCLLRHRSGFRLTFSDSYHADTVQLQ